MDVGKIIEATTAAGPGAGIGLAIGLLVFIGALLSGKVVMLGRFTDMRDQRDKAEREKQSAEKDRDVIRVERDELRTMVAGAIALNRKTAHLASSVMIKRVQQEGDPDDGPEPARLASGRG